MIGSKSDFLDCYLLCADFMKVLKMKFIWTHVTIPIFLLICTLLADFNNDSCLTWCIRYIKMKITIECQEMIFNFKLKFYVFRYHLNVIKLQSGEVSIVKHANISKQCHKLLLFMLKAAWKLGNLHARLSVAARLLIRIALFEAFL